MSEVNNPKDDIQFDQETLNKLRGASPEEVFNLATEFAKQGNKGAAIALLLYIVDRFRYSCDEYEFSHYRDATKYMALACMYDNQMKPDIGGVETGISFIQELKDEEEDFFMDIYSDCHCKIFKSLALTEVASDDLSMFLQNICDNDLAVDLGYVDDKGEKTEKLYSIFDEIKNEYAEFLLEIDHDLATIWLEALKPKPDFVQYEVPEYKKIHAIDYDVLASEFKRDELSVYHRNMLSRKSHVLAEGLRHAVTGTTKYYDCSQQKLFEMFQDQLKAQSKKKRSSFELDTIKMCLNFFNCGHDEKSNESVHPASKDEALKVLADIETKSNDDRISYSYNKNSHENVIVFKIIRYALESDLSPSDCWAKFRTLLACDFTDIIEDIAEGSNPPKTEQEVFGNGGA